MHGTLLTFALSVATLNPASDKATESREGRIETLVERIEEARVRMHIPGLSLAVVVDDEVVLARGFGLADLDSQEPVTAETCFGIGSTTKAFTATLVGMLADEGKLRFDDPVTDYLPYFELDTGDANEPATLRDLLSHRSGFTRMTLLSTAPGVPRETILRTAAGAQPWGRFRKDFHYNNVMFLAAGVAAGTAADSTWDELTRERILSPLGMTSTVTTFEAAREKPDLASGYFWDEDQDEYEPKPMVDIDSIGPAGSIVSNATDMARWLRFQLAAGELEGTRLIDEETLRETWSAQMPIAGGTSYGLGWFRREWQGQPLIEHGGNTEGFAAEIAMLPEEGVGFVLLTNTSVSPLQSGSVQMVFDTLLGEIAEDVAEGQAVDFDEYLGGYVANFATFQDALFTVQEKDGKLAVDVPGQTVYSLHEPDDEGKWYFELTDQIAVSFDRDDAGRVVGMKMYQAGFSFELPREGVEIEGEIPVDELARFLGEYESEDGQMRANVVVQNNRLAVDIPNEMVFELHPPDEDGLRTFRIRSEVGVAFTEGDGGEVEAFTLHQGGQEKVLARVSAGEAPPLPSLEQIMELRQPAKRVAALQDSASVRFSGKAAFVNSGLEGSYELLVQGEAHRERMDFGQFGSVGTTSDGTSATSENPLTGRTALDGDELENILLSHPRIQSGDWRETYDEVRVVGVDDSRDVTLAKVKLVKGSLAPTTFYVDLETGDVVRSEAVVPSDLIDIPVKTRFSEFREVDGVRIPHRIEIENDWSGLLRIDVESIEEGASVEHGQFDTSVEED